MTSERLIGVDVGASKIKAAVVDPRSGDLASAEARADTPPMASPWQVATKVAEIVGTLSCDGIVGVALPCVVRNGTVQLAANLSPDWVGTDAVELLANALGRPVVVMNDADAAGLAEARFGAAAGRDGTVLVLTFGTGIGSALIHNGVLVPRTEFGHAYLDDGVVAEKLTSANVRALDALTWDDWAKQLNRVLNHLAKIVQPDLVIIGGGISDPELVPHWHPLIDPKVEVTLATFANQAGIVGASLHAASASNQS